MHLGLVCNKRNSSIRLIYCTIFGRLDEPGRWCGGQDMWCGGHDMWCGGHDMWCSGHDMWCGGHDMWCGGHDMWCVSVKSMSCGMIGAYMGCESYIRVCTCCVVDMYGMVY